MTLGMTLVYPVQWGVAIRGAHGSYRAPARCSALSGFLSAIREIIFSILPRRKKSANRVFAKKIIQPIIPSNLKKAKFIRASL